MVPVHGALAQQLVLPRPGHRDRLQVAEGVGRLRVEPSRALTAPGAPIPGLERRVSTGHLEAWWDTDSGRQLRTLAETHKGDYILGTPPGEMAYWARPDGADTVDIYTSSDGGADWEVDTREATGNSAGLRADQRSPDGAYLAYSIYPRLTVWRAEASGGPFRQVYAQSGESGPETTGAGLWTQDELVFATANATVAVSDDDGLTWTTIETWR